MTESEAIEAILEHWENQWDDLHVSDPEDPDYVPWCTRNESKTTDDVGELGAWVRITINPTTDEQVTMGGVGSRKFHQRGTVMVQIFVAVNHIVDGEVFDGDEVMLGLVEDVRSVFRQRIGDVNTYGARRENLPEDGVWNACVVVIEYRNEDRG